MTILFADLVGSTALHERLDPESARRFMESYYAAAREAVEGHGGTVTQLLGDGVKAVFGIPRVAEDDALRAVRAAVALQESFHALAEVERGAIGETGLRVAVNTGEVVAKGESEVIGDPVNVAARLQEQGADGDVVVGQSTERLVSTQVTLEPLGSFALKGRAEAVKAYRVTSLEAPAGATTAAFIGRNDELARLAAVFDQAVSKPAAHLALLLGSPGLGKSRLIGELARRNAERATVVSARCDAAGGDTFGPVAGALRELLGLETGSPDDATRERIEAALPGDDRERARIATGLAALLAGSPAPPEETFFVVRRMLAGLAAARPVILVVDDLQWAEPLLLDLVEHLIEWGGGVRLFVLAGARPELRDMRTSLFVPGGLVSEIVTLSGLDAGAAMRLAANVIGAGDLPAAVAAKVLATSEGNPLFIGELIRMLVHEGALVREGDRWTTGTALETLEMPPTIHALLAARIERLEPREQLVLERAAVVGRQFSRSAVAGLLSEEKLEIDAGLDSLRRSDLVERDTGWFLGEPMLRFHHVLIRDAAYGQILKGTRAKLHERFADWVEQKVGESIEHDETIGRHLEQAHRLLGELGPIDEAGRTLGERASARLSAAGRRALERDDVPLAASLLGRSIERLEAENGARADLALDWCEALLAAGDVGTATGAIDELGRFLDGSQRLKAWHACFVAEHRVLTSPEALEETARDVASAATSLASQKDDAGEAKAHFVHALALARLGRVGACEASLDQALAAARRAGDRRRANTVLAIAPRAALWGPSPVTRASGRCLDVVRVLRITQGSPAVEAVALDCQGVLEALRGRTDAAHRMIESARRLVEELGVTQRLLETDVYAGLVALYEGDATAAEQTLRRAYEGLRDLGLGIDAAQAAALLARALLAQDRVEEAEALSHESEALAGDDLKAAIAWRGVRAEALARRGEHDTAIDLATKAVGIAEATDALLDHADARLALAAALRAAGRAREAAAEERQANDLWEKKGATILLESAAAKRAAEASRHPTGTSADAARGTVRDRRARPGPPRSARTNAAIRNWERQHVAAKAGDFDTLAALVSDRLEVVDHPTGSTYGVEGHMTTWRAIFRATGARAEFTPLAAIGDSLALFRSRISSSESEVPGAGSFGPSEIAKHLLVELDNAGRQVRFETFEESHLGDAITRIYELYAESLPEGSDRDRAAATARSIAAMSGAVDLDRAATAFSPDAECVDHRVLGTWNARGTDAVRQHVRALAEVAENVVFRDDDLLALEPGAFLTRRMNSGVARVGGGVYERYLLSLQVFDTDGLVSRWEIFDADREAEALARFDELTGAREPATAPLPEGGTANRRLREGASVSRSRVRPNAACAWLDRWSALVARQDWRTQRTMHRDDCEFVDHPTGTSYGPDEAVASIESLFRSRDAAYDVRTIATLGTSLFLARSQWHASGAAGRRYDVGPYEYGRFEIADVDDRGLLRRWEAFGDNRLGDAITRLYELYAESLPEGSERHHATATARSVAAMSGAVDLDRVAAAYSPDAESVDHRVLGTWNARGTDAVRQHIRALAEVAEKIDFRDDEVLALEPGAYLTRRTNSGVERVGGGLYERVGLSLLVFGSDGLVSRWEIFDLEQEAEALARFDELAGGGTAKAPVRRGVRPNAATANHARCMAAFDAHDYGALRELVADGYRTIDHPTGAEYGVEEAVRSMENFGRSRDARYESVPIASLGPFLLLGRDRFSASGLTSSRYEIGEYDLEKIRVMQVDERGLGVRLESFAPDHLGEAIALLYRRYAELLPEGPERERAAATVRTVEALIQGADWDLRRFATAFAPDIQGIDHRILGTWSTHGSEEGQRHIRSLLEVAENVGFSVDDVLGVDADTLLLRRTHTGVAREGGGAYERPLLFLVRFGADGLVARSELFDADREADALARFDELTGAAGPVPGTPAALPSFGCILSPRRRVRPNSAVLDAAFFDPIRQRDFEAFRARFRDAFEEIDHATGSTYGRDEIVRSLKLLLESRDPFLRHEPLATLGESLCLMRRPVGAGGLSGGDYDVGAWEDEKLQIVEVDGQGLIRRSELFHADHLGEAIVRLHERNAELLPGGPERDQAVARTRFTAERIAASQPLDVDRYLKIFAPDCECVDHRTIGTWSGRGIEALRRDFDALLEVADDVRFRLDDILGLGLETALVRGTHSGIFRKSGGRYERPTLQLLQYGPDGRVTRNELFDVDREADALARFDELTGAAGPVRGTGAALPSFGYVPSPHRRVRRNAAVLGETFWTALERSDLEAFRAHFRDDYEVIDHSTGSSWGLDGVVYSIERLLRSEDPYWRQEILATLGHSLALVRRQSGAGGTSGRRYDVGPYEDEKLEIVEVDDRGLVRRTEVFQEDHVGRAIARLYERYAELLPKGPERDRAVATASRMAGLPRSNTEPFDLDRFCESFAPDLEIVDHRLLGTWNAVGAEEAQRQVRALRDLASDIVNSVDDVLGLEPGALLVRGMNSGTLRDGGGRWERPYLLLSVGSGGQLARLEYFDVGREADALARFDELAGTRPPSGAAQAPSDPRGRGPTGEQAAGGATIDDLPALGEVYAPHRRVRPLACLAGDGYWDTLARRDFEATRSFFADDFEEIDHTNGATYGADEAVTSNERLLRSRDAFFRFDVLATLEPQLMLSRRHVGASGASGRRFDVGPYEDAKIQITEHDDRGRRRRSEVFHEHHLGQAITRFYERYAELLPEGPDRDRAATTARAARAMTGLSDVDRMISVWAPDIECIDHRTLGTWSASGAESVAEHFRSLYEVAADVDMRDQDVLALEPRALLVRRIHTGTERLGGGVYEREFVGLFVAGTDGKWAHIEIFDVAREADALARFDALTGTAPPAPEEAFANEAWRAGERFVGRCKARDWDSVVAMMSPEFRMDDRRRLSRVEADRDEWLRGLRLLFDQPASRIERRLLGTRGERLALSRFVFRAAVEGGGPLEFPEAISVWELGDDGQLIGNVFFDADEEDAAWAELDRRYDESRGNGQPADRAHRSFSDALAQRDWEALARTLAPDVRVKDRRLLGWGEMLAGVDKFIEAQRVLVDLAPDALYRAIHFRAADHVWLREASQFGKRDGGAFENRYIAVTSTDADGLIREMEMFDVDHTEDAFRRFEEIMGLGTRASSASGGTSTGDVERRESSGDVRRDLPAESDSAFIAGGSPAPPAPFVNAACRVWKEQGAFARARDWEGYARCLDPGFRFFDRRRLVQLELDRDGFVEMTRALGDMPTAEVSVVNLATRGNRLGLWRLHMDVAGGDVGPSELEHLNLIETDERGEKIVRHLRFDAQDLDAAYAELGERWYAGDGTAPAVVWARAFGEALESRDLEALERCHAPGVVGHDFRLAGWGTLEGRGEYLRGVRTMFELAPDARMRANHARLSHRGLLNEGLWFGTRDGGAFESPFVSVIEVDEHGRCIRIDIWDPQHLDRALARFEEICNEADPARGTPGAGRKTGK